MSLRRGLLHDPYLVGNGRWCSCCFPDGPPLTPEHEAWGARPGCNECVGKGRVAFSAEEIVAATRPRRARSNRRVAA